MKVTFRDIMQKFWLSTSIRGVPRAIKSTSSYTRAFWALTMICCFAMLIYQLLTLLIQYYSYIVAVNSYNQGGTWPFPDVTICNLNPYNSFATFDLSYGDYLDYLTHVREQVLQQLISFFFYICLINITCG